MRRSTLSLITVVSFVWLLAAAGALLVRSYDGAPPILSAAAAEPSHTPSASASAVYAAAAGAYRNGDLEGAREALAGLARAEPAEVERTRTLLGLYEYEQGRHEQAVPLLTAATQPVAGLEDWRLYALADASGSLGRGQQAAEALSELVVSFPGSPLRGPAILSAAELAWERGDANQALALVELARQQGIGGETGTGLDVLAWRIGVESGDDAVERIAAKRLLVHSPVEATRLRVGDIFRDELGRIDSWEGVLTREEVEQRGRSWLAAGQGRSAWSTLRTVPAAERGFQWHLLMGEALTAQGRGLDAYELLHEVVAVAPDDRAALEWQRAMAAADAATVRRGRENPPVDKRRRMLEVSQRHLRAVVELELPNDLSVSAVRELYAQLSDDGRFDDAMEMLQLLRRLDPADRTGAGPLWERGWKEYRQRNYTGAIGVWSQLEQLYPDDRDSHRGRYWKARALEAIGEERRATSIYRELVGSADTADLYVRQAALRLGVPGPGQVASGAQGRWPQTPRLARVLELSDLGLDELARVELGTIGETTTAEEARDRLALDGILAVRGGQPRDGVQVLRAAFPALGGAYQAGVPRPVLEAYYPLLFREQIEERSEETGLPAELVAGIIRQESAFDTRAESWAGARGLMQLMPATAKEVAGKLGVAYAPERLFEPEVSIRFGTTYFKHVLDRFDGNVELALAGYNGGPNRIRRLWREAGSRPELDLFLESLPISESQAYVKRILVLSDSYRQLYALEDDGREAPAAHRIAATTAPAPAAAIPPRSPRRSSLVR